MTNHPRPTSTHLPRVRSLLIGVAALLVLVAIVFGPQLRHGSFTSQPAAAQVQEKDAPTATPSAVRVRALTVHTQSRSLDNREIRASGTLEPRRQAPLAFAVGGVVTRLDGDEGSAVDAGAPLARLDRVPFESAVQQARARVDYLEKSLARSATLRAQKALSEEEFDAQEAELSGARAQLQMAEWNLDRSELRAPFDGHVVTRHLELGQVVAPGTPAFDFVELTTLEVDAALPATDLGGIDLDAAVVLISRDDPRIRAVGRVDHAPIRSDQRSGTIPVRVVVDNAERRLLPGMVVEVEFAPRTNVEGGSEIVVPLSALRLDDDGASVWRIEGDRVQRIAVELGPVRGARVVVSEGLHDGDRIVDEAPDRLREGDVVETNAATEVQG